MKKHFLISLLLFSLSACASTQKAPIPGISSRLSEVQTIALKEGRMSYEDSGSKGPVIILVPGIGETRGSFRLLAPMLVQAGMRVIAVDPRGQGDSEVSFSSYSASAVGEDLVQLIDHLNQDVYLVGNSSGGASSAWAAASRPERVKGVIFLGAFLRDHPISFFNELMLKVALRGPWAPASWVSYYRGLFITNPPKDQEQYTQFLKQSLEQEGQIPALRQMIFASKSDVEARLKDIRTPVLAISGSKDPDFENGAEKELDWIISQTGGQKQLIQGAGHYPHLEYPEQIAKLIREFVAKR